MYAHTDTEIYLTLYGSSKTDVPLPGGKVAIQQTTDYPFDGKISLEINPATSGKFALKLRIPTWAGEQFVPGKLYSYVDKRAGKWTLKVNDKPVTAETVKGFATIDRKWSKGNKVELNLPMPVRFNTAVNDVKANRNRIALTRGPLVYCAEQADNGNEKVQRFFMPKPASDKIVTARISDGPLKGMISASLPAMELTGKSGSKVSKVNLIPYYAWNNRGKKSMIVWFPRNEALAREGMKSNLLAKSAYGKVLATHTFEHDTVAAVIDGRVPEKSSNQKLPRWTTLPFKNRCENIIFEFPKTRKLTRVSVFWYTDGKKVKLPRGWWVDYKVGGSKWARMKKHITDDYALSPDKFNMVRPAAALRCDAMLIRILPTVGFCSGVHEIQLKFEELEK
jgi:hypothetical protein